MEVATPVLAAAVVLVAELAWLEALVPPFAAVTLAAVAPALPWPAASVAGVAGGLVTVELVGGGPAGGVPLVPFAPDPCVLPAPPPDEGGEPVALAGCCGGDWGFAN